MRDYRLVLIKYMIDLHFMYAELLCCVRGMTGHKRINYIIKDMVLCAQIEERLNEYEHSLY